MLHFTSHTAETMPFYVLHICDTLLAMFEMGEGHPHHTIYAKLAVFGMILLANHLFKINVLQLLSSFYSLSFLRLLCLAWEEGEFLELRIHDYAMLLFGTVVTQLFIPFLAHCIVSRK